MSVSHATAVRTILADAAVDQVDAGSGAGKIRIRAGSTTLCDIALADPAFGAAVNGVASLSSLPRSGTAVASGTADNFQALDSDNNVKFSGSVTATGGGGDLTLDTVTINNGETITINSGAYTAPA